MRAETSSEQAETVFEAVELDRKRVGHTRLEPAVCPSRDAAECGTAIPGMTDRLVDAVEAPEHKKIGSVATRDHDHIRRGNPLGRMIGDSEERDDLGVAMPGCKCCLERTDRPF